MGNLFTSLTSKIYGGVAVIAIAGAVFLGFQLAGAKLDAAGKQNRITKLEGQLELVKQAELAAVAQAVAARAKAENDYLKLAAKVDRDADILVAQARADAERYIARNRVPRAPRDTPQGPGAPATGDGPGDGQAAGGVPQLDDLPTLVTVTEDDVRVCTVNTLQAISARNWALELEATTSK